MIGDEFIRIYDDDEEIESKYIESKTKVYDHYNINNDLQKEQQWKFQRQQEQQEKVKQKQK